ncbi:metallophosphoesterase [Ornithinimicrobium sp. LYQ103]|uniref:metallophosphoesterase n=1 Tax=Ornithinimicrobium sp. LYQ103 TaxID=3378796 RepID=UPI003853E5EF
MVRFLHSADWQIGMTRRFLSTEAQARFSAARVDAIRRLGRVADQQDCAFVVVCGDVFESNQLMPQTVRRALEALREVPVPVFLLPGNHDPLDAMSVYTSAVFTQEVPGHVTVLTGGVHTVGGGVELVAAPWHGKHPGRDLLAEALALVPEGPAPDGTVRVLVGHGAVDVLDPDRRNPATIATGPLLHALDEGRIHYVALGDRHSRTEVAGTPAIHYAGAPEPTSFRETRPGDVLVVEAGGGEQVRVTAHHVGTWTFLDVEQRVERDADVAALDARLARVPDKDRTVVRLALSGTLTLAQHGRLEDLRARHRDTFAAVLEWSRHTDLAVISDDTEWEDLGLSGFLAGALAQIREEARPTAPEGRQQLAPPDDEDEPGPAETVPFVPGRGDDDESARGALALLYRLTRGGAA